MVSERPRRYPRPGLEPEAQGLVQHSTQIVLILVDEREEGAWVQTAHHPKLWRSGIVDLLIMHSRATGTKFTTESSVQPMASAQGQRHIPSL